MRIERIKKRNSLEGIKIRKKIKMKIEICESTITEAQRIGFADGQNRLCMYWTCYEIVTFRIKR